MKWNIKFQIVNVLSLDFRRKSHTVQNYVKVFVPMLKP